MDMAPLESFLVVARVGNVTRAAAELGLTQPAVSNQLARLEGELGQALFDRTPRGVALTAAGELFRGHVEDALAALGRGRQALDALAGLEVGTLSIGGGATATTYLLPPLLGAFHADHPAVRIFVREQGSAAVAAAVGAGELDLGIVTLPLGGAERARLRVIPWLQDELVLIVPPGHPLERRRTFRWRDLDGGDLVLFEAGSAVRGVIDDEVARAGVRVETVMELRSIESIKQMVAQGIGAGFVSPFALARGQRGRRCADGALRRDLGLVVRADRAPSPAARAFLALLRRRR